MNSRSSRHTVALLATVAALSLLAVPAFTVVPMTPASRAIGSTSRAVDHGNGIVQDEKPAMLPLSCDIKAVREQYVVGEVPEMMVRLKNESGKSLVLVGSLDASDIRWRYPYCYYEIEGPPGSATHGMPRCGMTNPLRVQDFVTVKPGMEFDPNRLIDDYGFFAANFDWRSFSVPGTYRLTYVYSTASNVLGEWVGHGTTDGLKPLFDQVPKGLIRSNTVEVEFAPPPGGYVPHTNYPLNHPESQNRGGWFVFKLLSGGPIKPIDQRMILLFDGLPDGTTGEQTALEFANTYTNLYADISTLLTANPEMSRPTTLVGFEPDLKVLAEAALGDFRALEQRFRDLPTAAVSREVLLRGVADATSNESYKEESVVVLVFTEQAFVREDIPEIRGVGGEKQNISVIRVTRRNGSWIPERVIGK